MGTNPKGLSRRECISEHQVSRGEMHNNDNLLSILNDLEYEIPVKQEIPKLDSGFFTHRANLLTLYVSLAFPSA